MDYTELPCTRAGHVLVSPIRTAARFSDLNAEEVMDLWYDSEGSVGDGEDDDDDDGDDE